MPDSLHDDILKRRRRTSPNPERLKSFRRYARGHQKGTLSALNQRVLRSLVGNLFCDNVCGRILAELRNRLRLVRFEVDEGGDAEAGDAEAVLTFLKDLWTRNQLAALSTQVHWATLRDGDHVVLVSWLRDPREENGGRVVLTRELWWNGTSGIWVAYDALGNPEYAVKEWLQDGRKRRVVYFDNRIERYVLDGNGWRPYVLPGDTAWPVPWTVNGLPDGEPIGLPFVHFRNLQVPQDPDSPDQAQVASSDHRQMIFDQPDPNYGVSELDGGLLGLQDEVNDIHRDITAAARFAGYQMYWASGITPQAANEDGSTPPSFYPEPGAFLEETNPDARFGTLQPGDMTSLISTLKVKLEAMSRMTSVPMFAIQNEWPSGEALIRAEMPLVDKVETIAASLGPAWASLAHKATLVSNVFGTTALNTDLAITAVFAPAFRRDLLTLVTIAEKLRPFVSRREVLRQLGYSPEKIDSLLREIEEDQAADPNYQRAQLALARDRRAAEGPEGDEDEDDEVARRINNLARAAAGGDGAA